MYFTYIVRCSDNSLYTGITNDIEKRIKKHISGKGAKYTASHPVIRLCAIWESEDRAIASRLEYHIKCLNKNEKEKLIMGFIQLQDIKGVESDLYKRREVD